MRDKTSKLITTILLSLVLTGLEAQEAIPATGGEASGSGGSASYTIGQVVYSTQTETSGSVAQGVQQPYEISTVTAIDEAKGISLTIEAYPNPTTDFLTLRIDESDISNFSFQLFDMNGKILQIEKVTGRETSIDMSNLAPASYFVRVSESNKEMKTFKIIKK